jgi:hypothetical protein
MRAYEIHTYRDGKWKMDSVFDDRELAVFEAKKITESTRYSGVKVIEEKYDELTDMTTTRTLYRGGAAKTEKAKKPTAAKKRSGSRTATSKEPRRKSGAKPQKKQKDFLVPVLVLLVLLMSGLALLFGIQYVSSLP